MAALVERGRHGRRAGRRPGSSGRAARAQAPRAARSPRSPPRRSRRARPCAGSTRRRRTPAARRTAPSSSHRVSPSRSAPAGARPGAGRGRRSARTAARPRRAPQRGEGASRCRGSPPGGKGPASLSTSQAFLNVNGDRGTPRRAVARPHDRRQVHRLALPVALRVEERAVRRRVVGGEPAPADRPRRAAPRTSRSAGRPAIVAVTFRMPVKTSSPTRTAAFEARDRQVGVRPEDDRRERGEREREPPLGPARRRVESEQRRPRGGRGRGRDGDGRRRRAGVDGDDVLAARRGVDPADDEELLLREADGRGAVASAGWASRRARASAGARPPGGPATSNDEPPPIGASPPAPRSYTVTAVRGTCPARGLVAAAPDHAHLVPYMTTGAPRRVEQVVPQEDAAEDSVPSAHASGPWICLAARPMSWLPRNVGGRRRRRTGSWTVVVVASLLAIARDSGPAAKPRRPSWNEKSSTFGMPRARTNEESWIASFRSDLAEELEVRDTAPRAAAADHRRPARKNALVHVPGGVDAEAVHLVAPDPVAVHLAPAPRRRPGAR